MLDSIKPSSPTHQTENKLIQKPKKSRFKKWLLIFILFIVALAAIIAGRTYSLAQKILEKSPTPMSFGELLLSSDKPLIGEEEGEIRVLLLGIGGKGHDGGTLTDTIILATLKLPTDETPEPRLSLISFPRDLVINIPGFEFRRINAAYAFAEASKKGSGPAAAIKAVEQISNKTIPYYAVVDFAGFEKIIDRLGGIEIEVKQGFTDARYPDNNNGFLDPITFEEGRQRFDGVRALQYVRSRHGNNGQGSDFARNERQQQVVRAVAEKISDLNILFNLGLINGLLDDLANNFQTNLKLHEMKRIYDLTRDLSQGNISSTSLSNQLGVLCDEIIEETGAYVLIPCRGLTDYSQIQELISGQFDEKKFIETEDASVEIQNASSLPGLANQIKSLIEVESLEISVSNLKSDAVYHEGIIYDNTGGQKPQTLNYLQAALNFRVAQSPFPFPTSSKNPDFVIVITNNP